MHGCLCGTETLRRSQVDEGANRKLIRASLATIEQEMNVHNEAAGQPAPPEKTNAESFYYIKQLKARTPMIVVLNSGEILLGVAQWYDAACIKINCPGQPNLLVMKSSIRYLYKQPKGRPNKTAPVHG